jgi:hypothetical protein
MAIGLDCAGYVLTDPVSGAVICNSAADGTGTVVPWTVTPAFDVSTLDPSSLTAYFCWGWFIVAMGWVVGKGFGLIMKFFRDIPT